MGTMSTHNSLFWDELDRYHDTVQTYERNVEVTHPDTMHSFFGATNITYYEYSGPNLFR